LLVLILSHILIRPAQSLTWLESLCAPSATYHNKRNTVNPCKLTQRWRQFTSRAQRLSFKTVN
jgi:hypothetical protein